MVARLDDYLRDVAHDRKSGVLESEHHPIRNSCDQARIPDIQERKIIKRFLMPAGMRGAYHTTALAGASMSLSIAPNIQDKLLYEPGPWREQIHEDIQPDVIDRLMTLSEFERAYQPNGMAPEDFITYGVTQKTLSQFVEAG